MSECFVTERGVFMIYDERAYGCRYMIIDGVKYNGAITDFLGIWTNLYM